MQDKEYFKCILLAELHDLFFRCPPEKCNLEEIDILLKLESLKDDKEPERIYNSSPIKKPPCRKITMVPYSFSHTNKSVVVTGLVTAVCIISMFFVGLNYSVGADPDTGFFYFLHQDKEGFSFMTNPTINPPSSSPSVAAAEEIPNRNILDGFSSPGIPDEMQLLSASFSYVEGEEHARNYYQNAEDSIEIGISQKDLTSHLTLCFFQPVSSDVVRVFYDSSAAEQYFLLYRPEEVSYYVKGSVSLGRLLEVMKDYIAYLKLEDIL